MRFAYSILNKKNGEIIKVDIKSLAEANSTRLYILRDEEWGDGKTFFGWRTLISNGSMNVVTADDGVAFGIYKYVPCDDYLLIDCIESVKRRDYKGIGLAMITDAILRSILLGYNGKIKLKSVVQKERENNPDGFYRSLGMEEELCTISVLNSYNLEEISVVPKTFYFDEDSTKEYLEKYGEFSRIMRSGLKWSEFSKRYEQSKSEQKIYEEISNF